MGTRWQRGAPRLKSFNGKNYESDGKTPILVCGCITDGESCLTDIRTASVPGKQLPKAKSHSSILYSPAGHVPLPFKCTDSFRKLSGYSALSIIHCSTPFFPPINLCLFLLYI